MTKSTALYDRHVALGARMVDFHGWMLPVQYPTGPKEEHLRVRRAAGLFDIDHMGQVAVSGPDALAFLQSVMTADLDGMAVGAARYALLCYEDGGVVDDTFIYRLADRYLVVVNASNNAKDTEWLGYHRAGFDVQVENVSEETYMLALQGPASEAILQPLCAGDLAALKARRAMETTVAGAEALVSRTGYTGEDGFELYFPAEHACAVWDAIMASGEPHGLVPAGLAARDSLRLEAAMPLYGQEISPERNPLQARLGWAVALDKRFVGREALLKVRLEGSPERLIGFQMNEGGVPRHGYAISHEGQVVGEVTSGGYAPTLDRFIGLGYVPTDLAAPGTPLDIVIRNRTKPARVVSLPFYKPTYRR